MCIYIYIYTYIYIYVNTYIYIYMYREREKEIWLPTCVQIYLVGPGNSLDVSVAFPSFTFPSRFLYVSVSVSVTFPSRFRRVSVAFPFAFPLRFCWASARPTGTTQQRVGAIECGRPSKSQAGPVLVHWPRPRLATCDLGLDPGGRRFRSASPICCR